MGEPAGRNGILRALVAREQRDHKGGMSAILDYAANRAVGWSVTADGLKQRQESARKWVLGLSIAGALLAAIASQMHGEGWHKLFAAAGAMSLALGTFLTARFLGQGKTQAWVRARAASEALKREAFKFAARATPYDSADAEKAGELLKGECRKIEDAAEKVAHPAVNPGRPGSAPREMLAPEEYRARRVQDQINQFYKPKADQYRKTAANLRRAEFVMALAATIVTAVAGVIGKSQALGGVTFDIAALTAVLTTISGAILTHIEASRLDHLIDTYTVTAQRLEYEDLGFETAAKDPVKWSQFVNHCEDIIATENTSWVAKWAQAKE